MSYPSSSLYMIYFSFLLGRVHRLFHGAVSDLLVYKVSFLLPYFACSPSIFGIVLNSIARAVGATVKTAGSTTCLLSSLSYSLSEPFWEVTTMHGSCCPNEWERLLT